MESRQLFMHIVLIKVSRLQVLRVLLCLTCAFSFLHGAHLENRPKWRVGTKILSVNILILNQGGPMNNVIPLPEDPWGGCMVSPPGPRSNTSGAVEYQLLDC